MNKIAFIGAGHVGSHGAYAIVSQAIADEVVLIDKDKAKAAAQALDIYDATLYLPHRVKIYAGDYSDIKDADILVVAVGPLPDAAMTDRMQTLRANIECIDDVVGNIRTSGFSGIIVNISNPADVVTHYIKKKLDWPSGRIISTSTTLDSARLRRALADLIGIDQKSIQAYALGEHGETQMVPWSSATVGGKKLSAWNVDTQAAADAARSAGWMILRGKGSTEFGIGASIAEVLRAILGNEHKILPVSVYLDGEYGIKDSYASVPAILGRGGVEGIIELELTDEEHSKLLESVSVMNRNLGLALSF